VGATACFVVITSFAVWASGAAQPPANKTTFEYRQYRSIAELTNAMREIKQRLDAAEVKFGSSDTNVAKLFNDLASCYADLGENAQALLLNQRSLSMLEALLGPEHKEVAAGLSNLAFDYWELGNYEQAQLLFQRSLTINERLLGPDHFEVATTLNDLADLYREQQDFARGLPLCRRALAIRQKVLGQEHPDVADSLTALAQILRGLGNHREALDACQRSMAICEKVLDPEHPLLADALLAMGRILSDLKKFPEALSAYQRAMLIDEKISGPDHSTVIEDQNEIAVLLGRQSRWDQCLPACVELSQREGRHLIAQTLALSDVDALLFIQGSFESTELLHSACAQGSASHPRTARLTGAERLALSKAFLEEVRAIQAVFDADPRTTTRALREQYHALQVRLDRLAKSGLDPAEREGARRDLQRLSSKLEHQLSDRSTLLAEMFRDRSLTLSDIARNLPPGAALTDFIQYRRYDFTAEGTNEWKEQRYAAYLTFPLPRESTNVVVERVDLGEAAPINEAVESICKRMASGMGYTRDDVSAGLRRLGDLVYAPMAKYLTNVSHLIVCPDGQLSRVPFEMLRVGDKFLIEEKTISYITSGREIVRLQSRSGVSPDPNPPGAATNAVGEAGQAGRPSYIGPALVIGGPDFDLDLSKAGSASFQLAGAAGIPARSPADAKQDALPLAGRTPVLRSLSRDYRGIKFSPLPGAEAEARSVAKLLGGDCVLRVGPDAREAELKAAVSPRILHLATHGFFLSDQDFKRTNALRDSWIGNSGTRWSASLPKDDWENPMVRCGIALAGANHAGQVTNAVAEDGLLTGLEASLLNLQGTELVILSACDSGTGEVQIGEGVMSLRRAFRIAGAQTVLASHWKVSDKATSQLMTEFIRRWRSGEPRAKAWREAQLSLLHSKEFSNPYFWAAFTLTGQWR
jgi:CHAT domain-containing protein/tetratricopeptide (TPR) repeat protein